MKFKPRLLSVLALLTVFTGLFFHPAPAQAKIGTHLGEGDIGAQVSIMNMLAAKGAEAGFPVTLMVETNTSEADLQKLADAVRNNNFFPIVRVNRSCDVNPQQARDQVIKVEQIFGSTAVITFGNEVNNPRECSSADQFKQNYLALDSYSRLSPSALDFYNADYPAADFLNQTGLSGEYRNAPVRTANAYGCTDVVNVSDCNPLETDTISIGTQLVGNGGQIPSSKLYLTEFSLNPNGGDSAPDTDLDQVRTFIESRGPETGAVHITPLVRNVCGNLQDEGEWLLYLHGDFYTTQGTKINPENCEALDRENPYEKQTKDPDDYYMYPLTLKPNSYWQNSGDPKDMYIYNLVVDQNYQVYKPSPKLSITTFTRGSWDAFFEWMERNGMETYVFSGHDGYGVDLDEGRIPLFRGMEAVENTEKISSFEGYFGSNHQERSSTTTMGVANNLLSQKQKCIIKKNNLETIRQMCYQQQVDGGLQNTLVNPEQCAFHKPIPDTEYYLFSTESGANQGHQDLLMDIYELGEQGIDCDLLSQPWQKSLGVSEERFEAVQYAISQMSLNLDYAYRWAFLIISPRQNPDKRGDLPPACMPGPGPEVSFDDDPFCFLYTHLGSGGTMKNDAEHAPIFAAFKIPVFGTNEVESYNFRDAASLTADAIFSLDQRKKVEVDIALTEKDGDDEDGPDRTRKQALLDGILEARNLPGEIAHVELPIFCEGMPMCTCAHNSCPLRMALVDIVNGSSRSPYGYKYDDDGEAPSPHVVSEDAGDIYTPLLAEQSSSRTFTELFSNQEAYDIAANDSANKPNWKWGVVVEREKDEGAYNDKHPVGVGVYIVAPIDNYNSTLHYLSRAMHTFYEKAQLEKVKENNCLADGEGICGEIPKYYPIKDAEFGFKASDVKRFHNPDKIDQCPCVQVSQAGGCVDVDGDGFGDRTQCKNDSARFKLDDQNVGLFYPGATFGWYVRKIQEVLNEMGGKAHAYISSCERTEDLFLGRCGGDGKYGPPDGLPYNGGFGPGSGACEPIYGDSPCSVDHLKQVVANWPGNENLSDEVVEQRAITASTICNAESGGNPDALNDGCLRQETVDYSVGLFQINLLAHTCGDDDKYFDYKWTPPTCNLNPGVSQSTVNQCVEELMDADYNIEYAMKISRGGANWSDWSTKDYCGL